jgi:hypothetical protein
MFLSICSFLSLMYFSPWSFSYIIMRGRKHQPPLQEMLSSPVGTSA